MALIIKGDMPKVGCEWTDNTSRTGMRYCPFKDVCKAYRNEVSKQYTINAHPIDYFPVDCPILGEIPDVHGDLIDRQAVLVSIDEAITERDRMIGTHDVIEGIVENAPTVVEASK